MYIHISLDVSLYKCMYTCSQALFRESIQVSI